MTETQMALCGNVRVREYGNAFIARCGKHRASCTAGEKQAAEACARKVMGGQPFSLVFDDNPGSRMIWRT